MKKYDKHWIKFFNLNKNSSLYEQVLNDILPNNKKCQICNNVIYYYDSKFRISKDIGIVPIGKSFLTKKTLFNKEYYLNVCEKCLSKKFPNYNNLNKSKVFNRICDITNYAFMIPHDISEKWKKNNYSITLEKFIIKYGKSKGEIKWKSYCKKQAITNSFFYKKDKYGWDKDKYNEYNKSRSVTLKNLIKRHGEDCGTKKWNKYIERQRYTCSLNYFKDKYGDELGNEKFNKFSNNRSIFWGYSKLSEKLFDIIVDKLNKKWTYFYSKNEYNIKSYLLDFYIKELNIGIEFNGDIWHANPTIFNKNDKPNPFNKNIKSTDIWEKDKKRIEEIKNYIDDIIIVWEKDLKEKGFDYLTDEIVNKINQYSLSKIKEKFDKK